MITGGPDDDTIYGGGGDDTIRVRIMVMISYA